MAKNKKPKCENLEGILNHEILLIQICTDQQPENIIKYLDQNAERIRLNYCSKLCSYRSNCKVKPQYK